MRRRLQKKAYSVHNRAVKSKKTILPKFHLNMLFFLQK